MNEKPTDLTTEELAMFESCKNEDDWNSACDKVKTVRGGRYPANWWREMKLSGRMDRILQSFGATSEISFERASHDQAD